MPGWFGCGLVAGILTSGLIPVGVGTVGLFEADPWSSQGFLRGECFSRMSEIQFPVGKLHLVTELPTVGGKHCAYPPWQLVFSTYPDLQEYILLAQASISVFTPPITLDEPM